MSVTLEQRERDWLIRMEGQITVASAAELKGLLLQWLACNKDLEFDLERVDEVDLIAMQLIYACAREAARKGTRIVCRTSDAVNRIVQESGFGGVPGFPIQAGFPAPGDAWEK